MKDHTDLNKKKNDFFLLISIMKYANEICFTRMCLLIGAVFRVAAWPMVLLIIVDLSSVLEMVNNKQTPIKCNVTTDSESWPNVFLRLIVPLENFYTYGDVTITCEVLQILTYARHS